MGYTDLVGQFDYKDLVTWQRLDALAENDAYDYFVAGTRTFFYQTSAPAGWTKLTSVNDKGLRMTSGSGGGTGGATAISATVDLTHSHTVNSHSHTHPSHLHDLGFQSDTGNAAGTGIVSADSDGSQLLARTAGALAQRLHKNIFKTTTPSDTGSTAPGTNTALTSTFALAYVDVIVCEKA